MKLVALMSPNTTTVPLDKLEVLRNRDPNNQIREREMANILYEMSKCAHIRRKDFTFLLICNKENNIWPAGAVKKGKRRNVCFDLFVPLTLEKNSNQPTDFIGLVCLIS